MPPIQRFNYASRMLQMILNVPNKPHYGLRNFTPKLGKRSNIKRSFHINHSSKSVESEMVKTTKNSHLSKLAQSTSGSYLPAKLTHHDSELYNVLREQVKNRDHSQKGEKSEQVLFEKVSNNIPANATIYINPNGIAFITKSRESNVKEKRRNCISYSICKPIKKHSQKSKYLGKSICSKTLWKAPLESVRVRVDNEAFRRIYSNQICTLRRRLVPIRHINLTNSQQTLLSKAPISRTHTTDSSNVKFSTSQSDQLKSVSRTSMNDPNKKRKKLKTPCMPEKCKSSEPEVDFCKTKTDKNKFETKKSEQYKVQPQPEARKLDTCKSPKVEAKEQNTCKAPGAKPKEESKEKICEKICKQPIPNKEIPKQINSKKDMVERHDKLKALVQIDEPKIKLGEIIRKPSDKNTFKEKTVSKEVLCKSLNISTKKAIEKCKANNLVSANYVFTTEQTPEIDLSWKQETMKPKTQIQSKGSSISVSSLKRKLSGDMKRKMSSSSIIDRSPSKSTTRTPRTPPPTPTQFSLAINSTKMPVVSINQNEVKIYKRRFYSLTKNSTSKEKESNFGSISFRKIKNGRPNINEKGFSSYSMNIKDLNATSPIKEVANVERTLSLTLINSEENGNSSTALVPVIHEVDCSDIIDSTKRTRLRKRKVSLVKKSTSTNTLITGQDIENRKCRIRSTNATSYSKEKAKNDNDCSSLISVKNTTSNSFLPMTITPIEDTPEPSTGKNKYSNNKSTESSPKKVFMPLSPIQEVDTTNVSANQDSKLSELKTTLSMSTLENVSNTFPSDSNIKYKSISEILKKKNIRPFQRFTAVPMVPLQRQTLVELKQKSDENVKLYSTSENLLCQSDGYKSFNASAIRRWKITGKVDTNFRNSIDTQSMCIDKNKLTKSVKQIIQQAVEPSADQQMCQEQVKSNAQLIHPTPQLIQQTVTQPSMTKISLQHQSIQQKSIQNQSVHQQLTQSMPVQQHTMQHYLMQDQSIKHKSMQQQLMQYQSMQHQSMQHQPIQKQPMQQQPMQQQPMQQQPMQQQPMQQQPMQQQPMQQQPMQQQPMQQQQMQQQSMQQQPMEQQPMKQQPKEQQAMQQQPMQQQPMQQQPVQQQPMQQQPMQQQPMQQQPMQQQPMQRQSMPQKPMQQQSMQQQFVKHQPVQKHSIKHQPALQQSIKHQPVQQQYLKHQSIRHQSEHAEPLQKLPLQQSIQHQSVQDQSVQHQSVQNQSVQNQSAQNQSEENQSAQNQSAQNQSAQNQSVKNQSVQHRLAQHQSMHHYNLYQPGSHHPGHRQSTYVQNPPLYHPILPHSPLQKQTQLNTSIKHPQTQFHLCQSSASSQSAEVPLVFERGPNQFSVKIEKPQSNNEGKSNSKDCYKSVNIAVPILCQGETRHDGRAYYDKTSPKSKTPDNSSAKCLASTCSDNNNVRTQSQRCKTYTIYSPTTLNHSSHQLEVQTEPNKFQVCPSKSGSIKCFTNQLINRNKFIKPKFTSMSQSSIVNLDKKSTPELTKKWSVSDINPTTPELRKSRSVENLSSSRPKFPLFESKYLKQKVSASPQVPPIANYSNVPFKNPRKTLAEIICKSDVKKPTHCTTETTQKQAYVDLWRKSSNQSLTGNYKKPTSGQPSSPTPALTDRKRNMPTPPKPLAELMRHNNNNVKMQSIYSRRIRPLFESASFMNFRKKDTELRIPYKSPSQANINHMKTVCNQHNLKPQTAFQSAEHRVKSTPNLHDSTSQWIKSLEPGQSEIKQSGGVPEDTVNLCDIVCNKLVILVADKNELSKR